MTRSIITNRLSYTVSYKLYKAKKRMVKSWETHLEIYKINVQGIMFFQCVFVQCTTYF